MLTAHDIAAYDRLRTGNADVAGDPSFAPLVDDDFSALPPTVASTAECDPLASDGKAYCKAIRAAGGRAAWFNEAGLVHGYLRAGHMAARAGESFARIEKAARALGKGDWPW